ncbi:MAG: coniferyl-aldehyde dehydrogenase, partial [Myxococcota bacterium]
MNAPDETTAVQAACEKLRAEYERSGPLSVSQRRVALRALALAINTHRVALTQTISEDFRGRSAAETLAAELFCVHRAAKLARRHVKEWAQPEPVELSVLFRPGRGRVEYQPLGVIGIISPWNYPVLLALSPMIGALAAGNRVLLKPSELTPKTSALLSKIIPAALGSDVVAVVTGGPEVGAAVARLPLDHLQFTGSAAVGRQVMAAAAERLVPVTLELGGKSPVLLHERYPLA